MAPVAQGISLTDLWGPAADNLFATGVEGVVLVTTGRRGADHHSHDPVSQRRVGIVGQQRDCGGR
jgi:hypothetical protein